MSNDISENILEAIKKQNNNKERHLVSVLLIIVLGVTSWVGLTVNDNQVAIARLEINVATIATVSDHIKLVRHHIDLHSGLITENKINIATHRHKKVK